MPRGQCQNTVHMAQAPYEQIFMQTSNSNTNFHGHIVSKAVAKA